MLLQVAPHRALRTVCDPVNIALISTCRVHLAATSARHNILALRRWYFVAIPAARTAIVGRIRYSVVSPQYLVEVVTRKWRYNLDAVGCAARLVFFPPTSCRRTSASKSSSRGSVCSSDEAVFFLPVDIQVVVYVDLVVVPRSCSLFIDLI